MLRERFTSPMIAVLIALTCALVTHGQGSRRRSVPPRKPAQDSSRPLVTPGQSSDSFWDAQRSIEAAIQQLESYIRESPDGERATTARQQVEALKGLSASAARPEWVKMGPKYQRHIPAWRVSSVDRQPDKVTLAVEITCGRDDGGDCYFPPFDRSPLVLIDSTGRYYPMLNPGDLPPDVRYDRDGTAIISGGRTVSIMVDFAPPSAGAASGQVYYRDNNRAEPARFSISRRR